MRVDIKRAYKQLFELPDFVVLIGKNGSGKSHLMELMARNLDCLIFDDKGNLLTSSAPFVIYNLKRGIRC